MICQMEVTADLGLQDFVIKIRPYVELCTSLSTSYFAIGSYWV